MAKQRLDVLLMELNYFTSRERARSAIMAGEVFIKGQKADKAGMPVDADSSITVTSAKQRYVSRGGYKLEEAIKAFELELTHKIVLDIGASTGGFTDCALQNGADKVYAVDVGYGQLAWQLRQDERVIVRERVNARYLTEAEVPEKVDIVTIDAAFISLSKLMPTAAKFLKQQGLIISLIKPQFEAGRENVGRKGVVRDAGVHRSVIEKVIGEAEEKGIYAKKIVASPIKGPEGNVEFLCEFSLQSPVTVTSEDIKLIVDMVHVK